MVLIAVMATTDKMQTITNWFNEKDSPIEIQTVKFKHTIWPHVYIHVQNTESCVLRMQVHICSLLLSVQTIYVLAGIWSDFINITSARSIATQLRTTSSSLAFISNILPC